MAAPPSWQHHRPDSRVREYLQQQRVRDTAVQHVRAGDPALNGPQARLHLGHHPVGKARQHGIELFRVELADDVRARRVVGVQPLHVGEHHQLLGAERNGQSGRGRVGVDVVDAAVVGARDAADHRNAAVVEQPADDTGVDVHDVTDQADVDLLAVDDRRTSLRGEQPCVLAGDADREGPVLVEHADDVALHLSDQNHAYDVHRLRRRAPQPAGEDLIHPQSVEMRVDLRAAAVHDDPPDAGVTQEDDVLGEGVAKRLVRHRMPAVLHHDRPAVKTFEPRQDFDENTRLGQRVLGARHVEYAEFSWTYAAVRSVVRTVAVSLPALRSTVMVTSRGRMSTRLRSSAAAPDRQIQTLLIATSTWSGSNTAVVVPTADRTRPQLGSLPCSAHLSRLLRATARPTSTASVSLAALRTSIVTNFDAPSASVTSWLHRSSLTRSTSCSRASAGRRTPLAPLASSSTVSFVDMQPSVSTRSNVRRVATRSTASRSAAGTSASVVMTHSMVASPGASMPAPLAMPPTVTPPAVAIAS